MGIIVQQGEQLAARFARKGGRGPQAVGVGNGRGSLERRSGPAGSGQLWLGDQQIGEDLQEGQSLVVLGQPAVARAATAEVLLDVEEGMLDLGPQRGALTFALGQGNSPAAVGGDV